MFADLLARTQRRHRSRADRRCCAAFGIFAVLLGCEAAASTAADTGDVHGTGETAPPDAAPKDSATIGGSAPVDASAAMDAASSDTGGADVGAPDGAVLDGEAAAADAHAVDTTAAPEDAAAVADGGVDAAACEKVTYAVVQPLFKTYCGLCHAWSSGCKVAKQHGKQIAMELSFAMPPVGHPQLTTAEKQLIHDWVKTGMACTSPGCP